MITHYRDFINPVCDLCGHMLGSEDGDQLAREAMARDGWVKRDGRNVCRMCRKMANCECRREITTIENEKEDAYRHPQSHGHLPQAFL